MKISQSHFKMLFFTRFSILWTKISLVYFLCARMLGIYWSFVSLIKFFTMKSRQAKTQRSTHIESLKQTEVKCSLRRKHTLNVHDGSLWVVHVYSLDFRASKWAGIKFDKRDVNHVAIVSWNFQFFWIISTIFSKTWKFSA